MQTNDSRPLSPHLQIYRLPLTAVLSITHRLTGVFLGLGALLLLATLLAVADGPNTYAAMRVFLSSVVGKLVLVLFTYALYFHFCNGVRHLFWDAGYGFELAAVNKTAYAVIAVSTLLTLATWLVAI